MARPSPEHLAFVLTFSVFLAFLAGMLAAWAWVLGRLWRGIPLLAGIRPLKQRDARWGPVSVVALIVLYLMVNAFVFRLYAAATGRNLPHAMTQAEPKRDEAKPGKAADPGHENEAADGAGKIAEEQSQGELMLQLAVINTVLILLLPATLQLTSGATLADLGIDLTDWKRQVGWGVWSAMIIIPAVIAIQSLAVRVWPSQKHPVELMVMEQFTPGVALLALLSTVLLAPILEEMLFRGVIQHWLCRLLREESLPSLPAETEPVDSVGPMDSSSMEELELRTALAQGQLPDGLVGDAGRSPGLSAGSSLAIVVTSVLFAAMHLPQWPAPLAILLLSMGLGALYQRTGSLLAAIAMHGTFNGFNTVLMILAAIDHQLHS